MLTALAVITSTVVGLMVGVEFAVAVFVNPILLRLPAGSALAARADGGRILGRVMPFWYFASLLLTAGLAAGLWGNPAAGAAVAGAALFVVSIVMSIAVLVPINNRSVTWTAEDHPSDWREQHQRWDRLHYARVAIIVAGFVLTLVAATALWGGNGYRRHDPLGISILGRGWPGRQRAGVMFWLWRNRLPGS